MRRVWRSLWRTVDWGWLGVGTGRATSARGLAVLAISGVCLLVGSGGAAGETLVEVFRLAQENDAEYLANVEGHRADREVLPQALAGLLPHARIDMDSTWNERRVREDYRSYEIKMEVDYPVFRRDRDIEVIQAEARISRGDAVLAIAVQDLLIRVADRYFAVLQAEDQLGLAKATVKAFEHQLVQTRERFEVGLLAITDVEEAKAERIRPERNSSPQKVDGTLRERSCAKPLEPILKTSRPWVIWTSWCLNQSTLMSGRKWR